MVYFLPTSVYRTLQDVTLVYFLPTPVRKCRYPIVLSVGAVVVAVVVVYTC